jgi:protein O-GlcNAc transferase
MKKVISFSLWGNDPTYNIGAIKNVELAKEFYPDFECWFYIHEESVPKETIEQLKTFDNVNIIFKNGHLTNENCKPRMWRFEAIDEPDVEIMMSRDTDTRFLLREQLAVKQWLQSNKIFHIMRDHPHHNFVILGGMFGTRKIPEIPSWKTIMDKYIQNDVRMYDQDFLRNTIYPVIVNNSIVHATFHKKEPHAVNFPIEYDNEYQFVGEYVYFDEGRSTFHINELTLYLNK